MLKDYPVFTTIPVADIERAKNFYEKTLGLTSLDVQMEDSAMFEAGEGTKIFLYQRGPSRADHTLASFMVENIEEIMSELKAKGVKFEIYDMPNLKTDEKGVATAGGVKSAWFKDPEGNILALTQK